MNEEQTVRGGLKLAMHEHTTAQRARAGLRKIRHQFPNTPEGKIMYAVVDQAVNDFVVPEPLVRYKKDHFRHLHWDLNKRSASRFLRSDMPYVADFGVEPEWIRSVFNKLDIDFTELN